MQDYRLSCMFEVMGLHTITRFKVISLYYTKPGLYNFSGLMKADEKIQTYLKVFLTQRIQGGK
jgi:hypothetical protein